MILKSSKPKNIFKKINVKENTTTVQWISHTQIKHSTSCLEWQIPIYLNFFSRF